MQAGFASIALSSKVVEGTVIAIDDHIPVAPRAKKLLVQQSIKRAGRNMLGRDPETGHLTNDKPGQTFDDWKKEAQRAAAQAEAELEAERAAVAKRLTGKTVSPPK